MTKEERTAQMVALQLRYGSEAWKDLIDIPHWIKTGDVRTNRKMEPILAGLAKQIFLARVTGEM